MTDGRKNNRFFKVFSLVAALFTLILGVKAYFLKPVSPASLQDGDLIFHTSTSRQSAAIFIATWHPFTHMGIIKITADGPVVIEAVGQVKETPLDNWIHRGFLKRAAIYRYNNLTDTMRQSILTNAAAYYSMPYDIHFSFDNEAIYCSELPYLAFQKTGLNLGPIQKIGDLHLDNFLVKKLIHKRWQSYPLCHNQNISFEQCYSLILQQSLISPAQISRHKNLQPVYSNYMLF